MHLINFKDFQYNRGDANMSTNQAGILTSLNEQWNNASNDAVDAVPLISDFANDNTVFLHAAMHGNVAQLEYILSLNPLPSDIDENPNQANLNSQNKETHEIHENKHNAERQLTDDELKTLDEATETGLMDKVDADSFMCPITHGVMRCPVVAADGFTYDKNAITTWLATSHKSPITGADGALTDKTLRNNISFLNMMKAKAAALKSKAAAIVAVAAVVEHGTSSTESASMTL